MKRHVQARALAQDADQAPHVIADGFVLQAFSKFVK
jgi:hypothetical protein